MTKKNYLEPLKSILGRSILHYLYNIYITYIYNIYISISCSIYIYIYLYILLTDYIDAYS